MGSDDKHNIIGKALNHKYEIVELIGEGGMGAVYKARHAHLKRDCAVKVIKRQHAADPVSLKRFSLEAQASSLLKHDNIIEVYDFGITEDGLPYIVMEYLSGSSLDHLLKKRRFLPYEEAIPIFLQICEALAHAHEKSVLHRDLKPGNIVLRENSDGSYSVRLVDFGIAKLLPGTGRSVDKLTVTGELFGSPLYMSPEQCMGQALDQRSDLYALGCMLYETLTGQLPFVGDSLLQVVMQHVNATVPPFAELSPDLAIPAELEGIVIRCMSKERALRFSDADEVKKALLSVLDNPLLGAARNVCVNAGDDDTVVMNFHPDEDGASDVEQTTEVKLLAEIGRLEYEHGLMSEQLIAPLGELFRYYYLIVFDCKKAIAVAERKASLLAVCSGRNSLDVADCYVDLGICHLYLKNGVEAEKCFRENLRIQQANNEKQEDLYTCIASIYIANALRRQGKQEESASLVNHTLGKIWELAGKQSLDAANLEIRVADYYFDFEEWELAYNHYQSAAEIFKDLCGSTNLDRRAGLLTMGYCMQNLDKCLIAEKIFREVTEIDRIICADPAQAAYPWSALGHVCYKLGKYADAEKSCLIALDKYESLPDPPPQEMLATLLTLSCTCEELGDFEKADAYRERADRLEEDSSEI